jgi:hypothetical protein
MAIPNGLKRCGTGFDMGFIMTVKVTVTEAE